MASLGLQGPWSCNAPEKRTEMSQGGLGVGFGQMKAGGGGELITDRTGYFHPNKVLEKGLKIVAGSWGERVSFLTHTEN